MKINVILIILAILSTLLQIVLSEQIKKPK